MTTRENELLRFIERYAVEMGCAPSMAEMRDALGLASVSGAHRLVESLVAKGRLRREGHTRSLRVVRQDVDLSAVPDGALLAELSRRGFEREREAGRVKPTGAVTQNGTSECRHDES